jgi:hypothetical protein
LWQAGTIAVPYGGTGLVSGTSGGIPYFSSTTGMGSSTLLTAGSVVGGGGAGQPPATIANGQLPATATNDSASAGRVGEVISAVVAVGSQVALTTATPANVATLSLTAGDWDIWGVCVFNPAGSTTVTIIECATNTVSATMPNPVGYAGESVLQASFTTGAVQIQPTGPLVVKVATTTSVYLVADSSFGTSTMGVYGSFTARRRR